MTWSNPGATTNKPSPPPPSKPKGHGSSDTSDPNVHVSASQKYKYTESGQLIQPVSTSSAAQVVSIKPGQVTYESSEQVAARQSAIVGGSIDPTKVQTVSPLGTVVFGPSTQQGAVEGEVARIAAKYPGYVAPNAQTQAYNIAQKLTPPTPNSGVTYPAWSGRQSDMEGGVRALAVAQEVGYYNGGMVASSAGPMPGRMMPVVRALHERMGIPFGGGMAGELLPESALSLGFERLFERRGREGLGVKPTLEVKGGTVRDIPYEQLVSAPSGTTFTVTYEEANVPTTPLKISSPPSGKEADPFDNVIKASLIPPIGFGGVLSNLPTYPEGSKVMEAPPKIYAPGMVPMESTIIESYTKPGIGSYIETGAIGAGLMVGFSGPLQVAAFKAGQYGINVGTALVGASSTIVGRVSREATVKYYTPIVEKIESYVPTQFKEPVAASLLTAGPPGLNIAFYYADKFVYGGNLTPGQRAGKVSGDVAEAVGIISTATLLGPKLIPAVSVQTAANKLSLTVSKPYSNVPEVDSSGLQISIRKGGNVPNILYDSTKIKLNEQVVAGRLTEPGLTQRVNPLVEESYLRSAKEVQLNTRLQTVPKSMMKELDIARDVKAFKGEPEYARVLTEELKGSRDLTGFGGVSRVAHKASTSTSDIDIFITSRRSSTSEAQSLLSKFQSVKGSPVRISPESPSLIEKQVGKGYVHMVDVKGSDSPEIQSGIKLNKDFFPYGQPITYESVKIGGVQVRRLSVEGTALRGASTLPKSTGLTPYTPEETLIFETKLKGRYIEMGGTFEPASHRIKDVRNFYDIQQRLIEAGRVTGSKSTATDVVSIRNYAKAADFKFGGLVDKSGRTYEPILNYYSKVGARPSVSPFVQSYGSTSRVGTRLASSSVSVSPSSPYVLSYPSLAHYKPYVPPSASVGSVRVYGSLSPSVSKSVSVYSPKPTSPYISVHKSVLPSRLASGSKSVSAYYSPSPSLSIYTSPSPSPSPSRSVSPSLTPFTGYIPLGGGGGVLWSAGGLLDEGRRGRSKRQRFVPAFVPSGGELFELFGEGRRVSRRASKKRRR